MVISLALRLKSSTDSPHPGEVNHPDVDIYVHPLHNISKFHYRCLYTTDIGTIANAIWDEKKRLRSKFVQRVGDAETNPPLQKIAHANAIQHEIK